MMDCPVFSVSASPAKIRYVVASGAVNSESGQVLIEARYVAAADSIFSASSIQYVAVVNGL
jgi:hypothetical protein